MSQQATTDYFATYSILIKMGFDHGISLKAAQVSNGVNEAINWIEQYTINNNTKDSNASCDGKCINNCVALERIILMLKFYSNHYNKYDKLNKYLQKYSKYLISDYHHILDKHLNEDNVTTLESNKQFKLIHNRVIDENNLSCDIKKCNIFLRNNRQRETININCNDEHLSLLIDIIDTIHCYFVHSVDIGYRIVHTFNYTNDNDNFKSNAFDAEMKQLRCYLSSKRHNLQIIRGKNRMINTKFMTHFAYEEVQLNQTDEIQSYQEDEKKENDDNNQMSKLKDIGCQVQMEGYLEKQSLYLKKFRKRFIILQNKCLYSYTSHKKAKLTELINLTFFWQAKLSLFNLGQFQLIPIATNDKERVFNAESMDEAEKWVMNINKCINPSLYNNVHSVDDVKESKERLFSFGRRYYYWALESKAKYKSIKQEVTSNKIYNISMKQFNNAYNKAEYLMHNSPILRNRKAFGYNEYGLAKHSPLQSQNILSVILYTDYDSLSYKLSTTFRKLKQNELDEYTKLRNNEFWHWCKTLMETVNSFGETLGNHSCISVFYHGVSFMYFNSFAATFNSPTSTTTKLQIATIFATQNGIILELGHNNDWNSKQLRYFNCTFVSCFGNEDERLFIQPPDVSCCLQFLSIRNMSTDENYRKYIYPMNILQRIVDEYGFSVDDARIPDNYVYIVNDFISLFTGNKDNIFPCYIKQLWGKWSRNVTYACCNMEIIKTLLPNVDLYDKNNNDLLYMDKLNVMFPELCQIGCVNALYNNLHVWKGIVLILYKINQLPCSKLREIRITMETNVFDDLAPHFTKVKTLIEDTNWKIENKRSKQRNVWYIWITREFISKPFLNTNKTRNKIHKSSI